MKHKKLFFTFFLLFPFVFETLYSQNIYFHFSNSTYGQYALSDIRSITFSVGNMNLNLVAGSTVTIPMNTISSFNYSGYTTDITNLTDKNEVSVYPNPSNGELIVSCSTTLPDKVTIDLLTINGELLNSSSHQAMTGNNSFVLNITDNLPTGNYLCTIKTSQGAITKKIIIIK